MSIIAPERVPFADLSWQWAQIRDAARPEIERLFERSAFCLGPWVSAFEAAVANYLDVPHAVAVSSGTAALHLAVLSAGIGPGDQVLVPAHTFIGSVWGLIYAGATPLFCDVDPQTGIIDLADAKRRLTPRVKAIIPVHLYGQPAPMTEVLAFARDHGLCVIEDVAQAFAARCDGKPLGGFGEFGCFSFYPGKNLGGAGEGGLVVTSRDHHAARLRALRDHGQSERYHHAMIGFNYRMDGLQGLVLGEKLKHIDAWTEDRKRLAARYHEGLDGLGLALPHAINGDHVYHLYVVRTARREHLRAHLEARGIQTGLHYPVPLPRQEALAAYAGDIYPVADAFATEGLSLPLFNGMTDRQQDRVIEAVREFARAAPADA